MPEIYERTYAVHSYEADHRGRLRPVALLNFLQDAAGRHAERLGMAVSDLRRRDLTWLLARYRAAFARYPRDGEQLVVRTWPSSRGGLMLLREFEVRDGDGGAVAAAVSGWMVLDLGTKRTCRPSECLPAFDVHPRSALDGGFSALRTMARSADVELPFRVRLSDLDLNRHVNHSVYVEWALETVPHDTLEHWQPAEIEIAYRAEALYPDRVLSRAEALPPEGGRSFLHQLSSEGNGRELARLRTSWVPAETPGEPPLSAGPPVPPTAP